MNALQRGPRSTRAIDVVGAVIAKDSTILCAQRSAGDRNLPLLWEFPGGKVEPYEAPQDALVREIREELQCLVEVGEKITTTVHQYDFATISLTTFCCALVKGTPQPTEHAVITWLTRSDLPRLEWAPADIPTVQLLVRPR